MWSNRFAISILADAKNSNLMNIYQKLGKLAVRPGSLRSRHFRNQIRESKKIDAPNASTRID